MTSWNQDFQEKYQQPQIADDTTLMASLVVQSVESVCNLGDMGSISGSGRSPGKGNGNPL